MTSASVGGSAPGGRRILVLMGAVGAGKGTQAEILSARQGLVHLASGDLFRRALRAGSPLGEAARGYMERGDLVPDDITIAMFMEHLAAPEAARGAILDGFPRTVGQAEALDRRLAEQGEAITRVIAIDVPADELVARVSGRSVCPTCGAVYHDVSDPPRIPAHCDNDGTPLERREDDRPEVVRARLERQVPPMLEVLAHYERAGIVRHVDGRKPIEAVSEDILAAVQG